MATITDPSSTPTIEHTLPRPFDTSSSTDFTLITQGAEALLYRTPFLQPSSPSPSLGSSITNESTAPRKTNTIALKYRPRKSYRHPTLDKRLTKQRILAEARVLVRCRREGVPVPGVVAMDWEAGWLGLEWIEGRTVRNALDGVLKTLEGDVLQESGEEEGKEERREGAGRIGDGLWGMMGRVGRAVGRLHEIGVVHGDLTTSNLMIRQSPLLVASGGGNNTQYSGAVGAEDINGEVVIIDFGLAVQTVQDEDRAVDLYVLERAFGATHPQAEGLFKEVLRAYGESFKGAKNVLRRLDDVRLRGRKKSMIG